MADINLNINILDGAGCPTIAYIDTTSLSVTINGGAPILTDNNITEPVPQDTTVIITVDKDGYDSYNESIEVAAIDKTIFIILNESVDTDFINITEACHSYTITNNGTSSDQDVTYTITDLDGNVIDDNLNVELDFSESKVFTSSTDGVYLLIVKDSDDVIIRNYVIMDICNILACYTARVKNILCACNCEESDCQDYCKKDYDMKRINLLFFDLFNRINREYRLNSYYSTVDEATITELTTAQEDIDKLLTYCSTCGDNTDINLATVLSNTSTPSSDCGCS